MSRKEKYREKFRRIYGAAGEPEDTAEDNTAEAAGETSEETAEETAEEAAEQTESVSEAPEEAAARTAAAEAEKPEKETEKKPSAEAALAEMQDRLVRNMAEFDNYRKRTDREKAAMFDMGVRSMAEKILPTIDNFERSLAARPEDEASRAYADGMEMVYRQLLKNLDEIGIKPIEALGKDFDPNLHNAVMHEEDDSGETNKVIEEFQKGYMYKDHVVRHSMVKVLN